MTRRPVLIVFLRRVEAGRAKTRLGREIGMTRAAWWQRHQVRRLLRELEDPRWRLVLAITPDDAIGARDWPAHLSRMAQGRGDLGQRMTRAISRTGPGPTLLIGSDVPGLGRREVAEALATLRRSRCVLCPSADGGYWGVGYRNAVEARAAHMEGVRWSTLHAMRDTAEGLPAPVGFGPELVDVDTADDLALSRRATP